MKSHIAPSALFSALVVLHLSCSTTTRQYTWKTVTFMDCDNKTFKVDLRINDALYDDQSGYLRVDGQVKNRLPKACRFNLRNWVYVLGEKGKYLKAQSVGLPVVPLQAAGRDGSSREESFTLVFKIGPRKLLSNLTIAYADQFFMTGKVNKIVLSLPLNAKKGTVTHRG